MAKRIVVIGSGGFAKEVAFLIQEINTVSNEWNFLGFIDDQVGNSVGNNAILNNDNWLLNSNETIYAAIGIGSPKIKKSIADKFSVNKNIIFPNLRHPNATGDWSNIKMGKGNVICSSCCFTTDIDIGNFNAFNLCTTLGHDAIVGDYNVINPSTNLSGKVVIGDSVLIGTNSALLEDIKIHSNTIIGAGSTVVKSITEAGTYVGTPAKK